MKVKLREYVQLVSERVNLEEANGDTYISTDNMLPNRGGIKFGDSKLPKSKTVNSYRKGDVLVSNIRPYFKKIWFANRQGTRSGDVLCFRTKNTNLLEEYLYCTLQSNHFFDYVVSTSKGTKMPRGDKEAILNYEFEVPPKEEQYKRCRPIILIEKEISLNNKINDNLIKLGVELLSSTKFKEFQSLSDVIEVRDGTHSSPASVSQGGYPLVTSKAIKGISVDFSQTKNISETDYTEINKRSLVEYHDILVSMIGTVGISHLVTENPVKYAIKNVGLIKSSSNRLLAPFLYFYLLSDYGQNYIRENLSGSTQQFISLTNLRKMPIPILSNIPSNLIEYLDRIVLQIENNSTETNILNSIKHVLLKRYF